MRVERRVDDINLVAECGDDLSVQVESLLAKLEELHRRGPALHHGSTIQFGWSLLKLIGEDEKLVVCEPAFEDPTADLTDDFAPRVDVTLRVLAEQGAVLHRVAAAPTAIHYLDKIVAVKGVLEQDNIYVLRRAATSPDDSGWYLGDADNVDAKMEASDLESLRVHQLWRLRKPVLSALALPVGYLAIFAGSSLTSVSDADNEEVWLGS